MSHAISPPRKACYLVVGSSNSDDRRVTVDATATSHEARNPLWIIVIAMACFFAVGALVIAGG